MAEDDNPTTITASSAWRDGREPGARRKKVYEYLKAANDMRQAYQSQWIQSQNQGNEEESQYQRETMDMDIVRGRDEELMLFPTYARRRHTDSMVDVDVRGWIYTPHTGPVTRKNRMLIAVARRLSGIPAPSSSPSHSRESSRHSILREKLDRRASIPVEDEEAARKAQSIVERGEGEANAAWRGKYSEEPTSAADGDKIEGTRSMSPAKMPIPGRFPHDRTNNSITTDNSGSPLQPKAPDQSIRQTGRTTQEDMERANAQLMARLKPFMHNPVVGVPITAFFFNDQNSQSRSVNTDESGHFYLRAALDFVPTSVRVLGSESLSVTEKVSITNPQGASLISDIDDTIKHSAVSDGAREIFANTFVRELGDLTINGVQRWYCRLAEMGVQLHYVSNSPWQLYPLLQSYFALAGLPPGSFHLKQYSGMLQGIFEPAAERKKGSLEKIMRDFPERHFILVGDSGEADLEVYSEVVMANPGRVLGVFIRDVTTTERRDFFDPSTGVANDASVRPGQGAAVSNVSTDDPTASSKQSMREQPSEDLIDLTDTGEEDGKEQQNFKEPHNRAQQDPQNSSRRTPPPLPSKPSSLCSPSNMQVHPGSHQEPMRTAKSLGSCSTPDLPSLEHKGKPPPKPARPSTTVDLGRQSAHQQSNLNRRQRQSGDDEEGHAEAARRRLATAYNTLPSARTLWNASSTGSQQSPSPSTPKASAERDSSTKPSTAPVPPSPSEPPNRSQASSLFPFTDNPTSSIIPSTTAALRQNISSAVASAAASRRSWISPTNTTNTTDGNNTNRRSEPAPPPPPPSSSSRNITSSAQHSSSPISPNRPSHVISTTNPAGSSTNLTSSSNTSSNAYPNSTNPTYTYNKKEETWRYRWARAEEVMSRHNVVLRTWRVGEDAMGECEEIVRGVLEKSEE